MEITRARRKHPTAPAIRPASPRLIRCRSGAPAISTPDQNSSSFSTSKRFINRSKSTRNTKRQEENIDPSITTSIISRIEKNRRHDDLDDQDQSGNCKNSNGFIRFLQSGRGSPRINSSGRKGVKSATNSPSAWALSPGRSSPCVFPAGESPLVSSRATVKNVGGVSGVLKYFKQKKVSAVQEEEYHRFRVLQNRLLQWRFVNARTEATVSAINITAQGKLVGVWIRIWKLRNLIIEKGIQVENLKHEIKLCEILRLELPLLNQWSKIDGKNYEALSRMSRKLSVSMVRVPLLHGAKGDVNSICEAMSMAVGIMESMQAVITPTFFSKVERIVDLVTEMRRMMEEREECMKEVENIIACLPSLLAEENSLRVHHILALAAAAPNKV